MFMELIDGNNLNTWRNNFDRLEQKNFLKLIIKITLALQHLHNKNIFHRDIKPENIMIRKNTEIPVILDFGVMKVIEHKITETGQFLGTRLYSPPEYLSAEKNIDWELVDVYCLGGVAYFLIKGLPPWVISNQNINELIEKKGERVTLGHPKYSNDMTQLIEKMLSPFVKERPSLKQVLFELNKLSNKVNKL